MLIIPSTIEAISTRRDNTIKIVVGTQELSPEKEAELFRHKNKLGFIAFKEASFQPDEVKLLTNIGDSVENIGKTPSERIRNVLFILFNKNKEGYSNFDSFYKAKTEMYIEHLKKQIDK